MKTLVIYNYSELSPIGRTRAFHSLLRMRERDGMNESREVDQERTMQLLDRLGDDLCFCENGNLIEVDGRTLWYSELEEQATEIKS